MLNEKSSSIKIGDTIKFKVLDNEDIFVDTKVINLKIYNNVEEIWDEYQNKKLLSTINSSDEFKNVMYSIFTTGKDLLIFLKSFLDNTLLKLETISLMLKHDDRNKMNYNMLKEIIPNESDINKMYEKAIKKDSNLKVLRTYNFMGTRYFNDISVLNDVPNICSKNTITFSGYTGPSFIIDFDKKVIVVIMCNVMHNTTLDRQDRRNITINIMNDICNKIYYQEEL